MAAQENVDPNVVYQAPPAAQVEPEKVLYEWKAPSRPFKRRDREFWVTVIAIAAIGGVILFLIEGVMPVVLIISVVFLFYVLSTVEPETIQYGITDRGVRIENRTTNWDVLTRFWFTKRFNSDLLVFEMVTLPGRLELVVDGGDKEKLTKVISQYVLNEEAPPSGLDKAANYFAEKLPLKK